MPEVAYSVDLKTETYSVNLPLVLKSSLTHVFHLKRMVNKADSLSLEEVVTLAKSYLIPTILTYRKVFRLSQREGMETFLDLVKVRKHRNQWLSEIYSFIILVRKGRSYTGISTM